MSSAAATSHAMSAAPVESRARHAIIAVLMQMIITVVYSWSVFRPPLGVLYGWSKAQTIMPNRYSLLFVAFGAVAGGLWQDRKGPRLVATVGGLLLAFGALISAFWGSSLAILVLGYGIIGGFGGGFAYVTPIANLVKWFPDKRGLMVGLAVMGSGLSTLFWSPVIETLVGHNAAAYHETIPRTFLIMATIFLFAIVGLAQIVPGPACWLETRGLESAGGNPPGADSQRRADVCHMAVLGAVDCLPARHIGGHHGHRAGRAAHSGSFGYEYSDHRRARRSALWGLRTASAD